MKIIPKKIGIEFQVRKKGKFSSYVKKAIFLNILEVCDYVKNGQIKPNELLDQIMKRLKQTRKTKLRHYRNLRMKALQAYGSIKPFCACCGLNQIEFLTIDHINNDGVQQRKQMKLRIMVLKEVLR